MRNLWRIQGFAALALTLAVAVIASNQEEPREVIERTASIPATVCPKLDGDAKSVALLPSQGAKIKQAKSRTINFVKARSNPFSLSNGSIVVAGSENSSAVIRSSSGRYTAATTCLIGSGDQWFIGGSGALGSTSRVVVVNSGLSTSTIEIRSFTAQGAAGKKSVALPAVSQKEIRLDSLAPGADVVALEVITRSGRVSAFLFDQKGRGLRSLGGEFVSSSEAGEKLVIPAIPVRHRGKVIGDHRLHIIATGARNAVVNVELVSDGSRFTPVGLSDLSVEADSIKSIKLPDELGSKPVALVLTSSEPIAASVSSVTATEFAWSSSAIGLRSYGINVGGLEPTVSLVGEKISAQIRYVLRDGKVKRKRIDAAEMATWKVPANTRLVQITSSEVIHLGASWSSGDGFTSLPLNPGTELERATTPTFDLGALFDSKE